MSNINSRVSFRRVFSGFGAFILLASAIAGSLTFLLAKDAYATAVPSSFQTFITNQANQGASNTQADGYYNQVTTNTFNNVCGSTNSSVYPGGVNGKDGRESWISFITWLEDGAFAASSTWRNKSNQLITLTNGALTNTPGMQMEGADGLCAQTIKWAASIGIPITAKAYTGPSQNKVTAINTIATKCSSEFSTASAGYLNTTNAIIDFLTKLSNSDYDNIVAPRYQNINQQNDPGGECTALASALSSQITAAKTAFCASNPNDARCQGGGTTDGENETSACSVEGIGWIICPVANAMAGMADFAFTIVAAFMRVEPLKLTPNDNPLYTAWAAIRSFANIAFVIAFLFIIFSQLTSTGISNYGVKKMLPRLVIAAILVNVSYYICALAVDISNIFGSGLYQIMTSINDSLTPGANDWNWASITASVLSLGAIGTIGGIAFTAFSSTSIWAALVGLLPLLVAALFALIIAFIVLLARQALIIMLIVLAPLAFVAYILPNTENLYKKWQSTFISLLMLFPMMALVFGGAVLAGSILRTTAQPLMSNSDPGQAMIGFFLYIGSLAVTAIPFFITPLLIRFSSGVLNRFAGFINNPRKGPFDRATKWAEQKAKNAGNRAYMNSLDGSKRRNKFFGIGARRRARNGAIDNSLENEAKRASTEYVADAVGNSERLQKAMAGTSSADAVQRVKANALATADKLEAEEISAANVLIKTLDADQTRVLALGGTVGDLSGAQSHAVKAAAMRKVIDAQDMDGIDALINEAATAANNRDSKGRSLETAAQVKSRLALADAFAASSSRPAYVGQGAIAAMRSGYAAADSTGKVTKGLSTSDQLIEGSIGANAYGVDKMAGGVSKDEIEHVQKKVASYVAQGQTVKNIQQFIDNAHEVLDNREYAGKTSKQRPILQDIAAMGPWTNAPAGAGAGGGAQAAAAAGAAAGAGVGAAFAAAQAQAAAQAGAAAGGAAGGAAGAAQAAANPAVNVQAPAAPNVNVQAPAAPNVNVQAPAPGAGNPQNITVQGAASPVNVNVQAPTPNVNVQAGTPNITVSPTTLGPSPTSIPTSFTPPPSASTINPDGSMDINHDTDNN